MKPQLPPPDPEPLVEREYRAEATEQMGGEWTIHDPENPDAWVHSDTTIQNYE